MSGYLNFLAKVKGLKFARQNRFKVRFFPPTNLSPAGTNYFTNYGTTIGNVVQHLEYMVESTEIPGRSLATNEITRYGPVYKIPYQKIVNDWSCVLRVTNSMVERKFFDAWYDSIVDPTTYNFNYYKEYTGTIEIIQLNQNEQAIYGVKLIEAYPTAVDSLVVDHNTMDDIQRLTVNFAYREWVPLQI